MGFLEVPYIQSEYLPDDLGEEKPLYSEWLLFYIAVQKYALLYTSKTEFENL